MKYNAGKSGFIPELISLEEDSTMKTSFMVLAMFVALAVSPRAQAQCGYCGIGGRVERIGTVVLNRGADIIIVRDTNRTEERINGRQMDSVDRQTDAYKDVAMAQIGASIAIAREQADAAKYAADAQVRAIEAQNRASAPQGNPGPTPSGYARRRPQTNP